MKLIEKKTIGEKKKTNHLKHTDILKKNSHEETSKKNDENVHKLDMKVESLWCLNQECSPPFHSQLCEAHTPQQTAAVKMQGSLPYHSLQVKGFHSKGAGHQLFSFCPTPVAEDVLAKCG